MGSDQEYAEAFRSIFTEAVRCRLRSAFPVGSMLSGGLDSSWIVCVARKLLADSGHPPLHTFSATFETVPQCDERRFIEAVVTQGGVEPHFIAADRLGPLVDLDRILRFTDEAFFAPNLYMHWALFQAAAGAGVRVLLDGLEGDAVVSFGVKRLAELTRSGRWLEVARSASKIGHDFGGSRRAILWRHAIKPCLPPWTRQMWLGVRNPVRPIWDPERIVNPTFSRQVRVGDRWRALLPQDEPRTEQENHLRRLNSALIPLLHEAVDTPAAFVGIEPAYPFADRRLVEFCLAAPSSQKLKGGWTRWLIRRAMEGILPPAVQWREGKSDLSPNFNRGMRELHREIIEEQLRQPGTLGRFVDMGTYREVCRRYLSSGTTSQAMAVWKAVTLGKWLSLVNWENREKPGK
jgi:asparagine synthase (glutamine-hydrolysing)